MHVRVRRAGADAALRPRRPESRTVRSPGPSSWTMRGRPWSCLPARRSPPTPTGHLRIATGSRLMSGTIDIDPVTLEVIRHALTATAEEMSLVVMRSARSPLLREAGDLSSALTDADGHLIAPGPATFPCTWASMSFTVREFLKRVPRETAGAGGRLVPQPAGGRRQPPARREGDPADLRRRQRSWPSPPASPTGRTSAAPCPAATSPAPPTPGRRGLRISALPPLHRRRSRPREARHGVRQRARRRRSARATSWPRSRPAGPPRSACITSCAEHGAGHGDWRPSPPSTTGLRHRCARRWPPFPTAPTRARTGSTTMPAAADRSPFAGASHRRGRPCARFDFYGDRRRGAGAGEHHALHRRGFGLLCGEDAVRPRHPAERRLLPAARDRDPPGLAPRPRRRRARWWAAITRPRSASPTPCSSAFEAVGPERISAGGPTTSGLVLFGGQPGGRGLDHPLRGPRRRRGRAARPRRRAGGPRAHVQRDEHAGRSGGGRVPHPHREPAPAPGLGAARAGSRAARACTANIACSPTTCR